MKYTKLLFGGFVLWAAAAVWFSGCTPSPKLEAGKPGEGSLDSIYANTPDGQFLKKHVGVSMGHGENAEERYQRSLTEMRQNPSMPGEIYETYKRAPVNQYFLRTLLVESLKECRQPGGLRFLQEIASSDIGRDMEPENQEWDTRQDEEVIRITAIEGISALAADTVQGAEEALMGYLKNGNLSIRQMSARGYLSYGDVQAKMARLREIIPQEEHWYLAPPTDIRKVQHPEMPEKFELPVNKESTPPKIKN